MNEHNITTKKMLKRFLGSASYISDHLPYASKLLHKLRQEAIGINSHGIKWTLDLIHELNKVKLKVKELITLYPVDPEKDIHGVTDTSYFANAAFFFQWEGKERHFVKIFSRRRSDCDNKMKPLSCEVELTGLLAAMLAAAPELERCNKNVIMYTDSQSVYKLYKIP